MRVKECMCDYVIVSKPSDTIENVAKLMNDNHVGCIPICDENDAGRVVGFVTDRDIILRSVACGKDAKNTKISDIMTANVIKTTPDTEIDEVTEVMSKNQVRRVPVIEDNKIVGILTIGDIAKTQCISKDELGATIEKICGWNKMNDK